MSLKDESLDDFLAKQNIEGNRLIWLKNRKKIDYVLSKLKGSIKNANTACDIGIGDGHTMRYMHTRSIQVTGFDISSYLVDYHREKFSSERIPVQVEQGDISKSSIGENKFDLVTCFDILEHIPGDGLKSALNNIARSLKEEGILIGTLPFRENLEDNMVICPHCTQKFHRIGHYHSFADIGEIRDLLSLKFELLKVGEVPIIWLKLNMLTYIGNLFVKFVRQVILKKQKTTIYFLAKVVTV
ncbi:MAG: class I SAM-dependent methyltransferase [Calditrichia bacterium]|jgi:SAM-dependent methyltransferase|nr:class I SAM-dependent methyltransferase [Calditrichia bacterium]